MASNNDELVELNKRPELLLLLAWNRFKISHPKSASVVSINASTVTFKFEVGKNGKEITKTHTFSSKELKASTNKEKFKMLVDANRFSRLPGGTIVVILMWVLNILALLPNLGLQKYALMIYQSEQYAWYAMYFLVGSHVLETLFALTLVAPILKSPAAILGWAIINLIYGFPQTMRALTLSSWAKKGKKSN